MRRLRVNVIKDGKKWTDLSLSYLDSKGEWVALDSVLSIPKGPAEVPEGATAELYPDDFVF